MTTPVEGGSAPLAAERVELVRGVHAGDRADEVSEHIVFAFEHDPSGTVGARHEALDARSSATETTWRVADRRGGSATALSC
jgi:hypothetical protein